MITVETVNRALLKARDELRFTALVQGEGTGMAILAAWLTTELNRGDG